MQLDDMSKMALELNKKIRAKFTNRVSDFCIYDAVDVPNHREFKVSFLAYDYFPVQMTYDNGSFGCSIMFGNMPIGLKISQEWWSEVEFDVLFEELKNELELRIPDKFLKSRGWL